MREFQSIIKTSNIERNDKIQDLDDIPSPTRLKGVESESALFQEQISTAIEKRKRHHNSAPRVFSYDKAEIKRIIPKSRSSTSISQTNLSTSINNDSSELTKAADTADRIVSTSYSESLEQILHAQSHSHAPDRQLHVLEEEGSRPSSAVVNQNQAPLPPQQKQPSGFMFDDINFIQYTSQELQYDQRKKTAKMVGRYILGDVLGEGSYGKVKEGYCSETLKRVAVKILKQSRLKKIQGGESNVKKEIAMLKKISHDNIVQLMDVILNKEKQKTYVVFEYCAATLQDVLSRAPDGKLPLSQTQRYMKQLMNGMQYLHSRGVIHRDIKPGNLLLTIDDTVKISDFGEIPMFQETDLLTTSSGSPAFQPPEITSGSFENFSGSKVDIWAVGVTLYHMISGKYPFDGESIYALFENIAKCEYQMPLEADALLADLIHKILEKDPSTRLSSEKIIAHNWMKQELAALQADVPVSPVDFEVNQGQDAGLGTVFDDMDITDQISNPYFSYDTTLIPYLETLYEEIPETFRRSSITEKQKMDTRMKNTNTSNAIQSKFLRRLSKPVIVPIVAENSEGHKRRPSLVSSIKSHKSKHSGRTDSDKSCKLQ